MAYAMEFSRLVLDSRITRPLEAGERAGDLAAIYAIRVRDKMGLDTPAFKRWLKYVYQYLSPHMSHAEIHEWLGTILWRQRR